jgi:hypothetical protein
MERHDVGDDAVAAQHDQHDLAAGVGDHLVARAAPGLDQRLGHALGVFLQLVACAAGEVAVEQTSVPSSLCTSRSTLMNPGSPVWSW